MYYLLLVGKIMNQVRGSKNEILSSIIVGDYQQHLTFTGMSKKLENNYIIKQYTYPSPSDPLKLKNILINIVFDISSNIMSINVIT